MKKILLVDDNEQDRLLYRRFLGRQLGDEAVEFYEATTGDEAVALLPQVQPDGVLLDFHLPDTDGLTLLQEFQRLIPADTLCVVMITGSGNESLAVRVLNAGALDYLVKGQFDREMLVKTVTHALERNELRQQLARYYAELQLANEQVRARNQELHAANQQLARTNADLDNFVYAASHDLKQPVHNLRGLFDELRRVAHFPDPEEERLLTLFDASLSALTTTINDLTTAVQADRPQGVQLIEQIEVQEVVADVLQTLRPQIELEQAVISTELAALPELSYVRGNLRTILLNLLANALKYRHPERVPQVLVRTYLLDGRPVLEVTDNGLGINLERHGAELFQLFRRFHPRAGEGTGVGLFLINRLVQAHGGHIEVDSREGEGTTFRVVLRG